MAEEATELKYKELIQQVKHYHIKPGEKSYSQKRHATAVDGTSSYTNESIDVASRTRRVEALTVGKTRINSS